MGAVPTPRYEIVVRGEIGPALRRQLLPAVATSTQVHTVLRARLDHDHDLADLVAALRAHGLEVESVTTLA